ncbi:MAG: hypothetical protein WEB33_03390 [Bacteroidota bacterium]
MARKRKLPEAEYRLRVFRTLNERNMKSAIAVVVETTKEFVNFHYEVLISDKKIGNTLTVKILGLHTPMSVMPGVGPARAFRVYEHSSGTLTVVVHSPDGDENIYKLNLRRASPEVQGAPSHPFILFSSQPVELPE